MKIVLIAAHDPNFVIGLNGELPWHYSEDLKFFKKNTLGHPIVMGRVVFEELNEKPLPGRENIVLSRSKTYEHVKTFDELEKVFKYLEDKEIVFIIGGGKVYEQTLPLADELIITEIKKSYEGDTYFPDYKNRVETAWEEVWREDHPDFSFIKYQKSNN